VSGPRKSYDMHSCYRKRTDEPLRSADDKG
jgi:hypothetical protein